MTSKYIKIEGSIMNIRRTVLIIATGVFAQYSTVFASPLFSLNTEADWQNALNNGQVVAVESPYGALDYYGTASVDYVQVTPSLDAMSNAESGLDDGLLMSWGDVNGPSDVPQVASWEYTYGVDPDLTGTMLNIGVMPPTGLLAVSLTLTDTLGGSRSWFWDVLPPAPGPSGVPAGILTNITLDPTLLGNQANSTAFVNSGFDHTKAISIIADELAPGPGLWTTFPGGPVGTGTQPWNYWTTLSVSAVPVPAAVWLFGSGLLGLVGVARRKKA